MMLTQSDIEEINSECLEGQGVFKEPNGIPVHIKEHVIYMRWETGGVHGGGCWDGMVARPYTNEDGKPKFKVLDLVLKRIKPNLTFLEFRDVEELIRTTDDTKFEYYGNRTDYEVEFIILSELYALLKLN